MEETEGSTSIGESRLTVLGSLKQRRADIAQGAVLDLPVPRWSDPEIFVRFRPVEFTEIDKIQKRLERIPKGKRAAEEVASNIDLLIRGCVAVFARLDGQDYSLRAGDHKGSLTTFDPDLAENLGLTEDATARDVVRELYIADGDIINTSRKLVEWSGYKNDELDESLAGE